MIFLGSNKFGRVFLYLSTSLTEILCRPHLTIKVH